MTTSTQTHTAGKPIAQAMRELNGTLRSVTYFEATMDSLVAFMLCLTVTTLISLSWYWAAIPTIIYMSIHVRRQVTGVSLHDVEHKVPLLHESLRTAADTVDKENVIVNELHQEVLQKMREIHTSYFVGIGRTTRQLVLLTILAFIIILSAAFGVKLLDFGGIALDLSRIGPLPKYATQAQDLLFGTNESDIYGNQSVAELGTRELQLKIDPLMSEINIDDYKPPEDKTFIEHYPPSDVGARQDLTYAESIPKEHQQIVKRYFVGISKG